MQFFDLNNAIKLIIAPAIKMFTCLYIFRLKSAYTTYVNTIMLAAIMSLITLFKSKYYVYMR